MSARLAWLVLLSLLVGSPAAAQPPVGPPVQILRRSAVLEGGALARVVTRWSPMAALSASMLVLGEAEPRVLVRGENAASVERGERVAIVAYETSTGGAPFRYRVIRHEGGADVLSDERLLERPGARTNDIPFAVAIAPMPGRGFAIFFEEVQSDDPSAARTYLFLLDLDGAALGPGREIAVPWPIAAAAWNGHGFHLGLIYPGTGSGVRLSMVSLREDGAPEQHPDWSSEAGVVDDVHLVVSADATVRAHYRGGRGGAHWLSADVTTIDGWGSARRDTRDHGAMDALATLVVDATGHVEAIVRPDPVFGPQP